MPNAMPNAMPKTYKAHREPAEKASEQAGLGLAKDHEKAADLLYGLSIYLVGSINKRHNLYVDLARGRASFFKRVGILLRSYIGLIGLRPN